MQASGPASASQLFQRLDQIRRLRIVDDFGAAFLRQPQPLRNAIDADHLARAQHLGAANGELSDRSAAPDRDDVTVLDIAVLGRHVAGREDVAQEEHLLVLQIALDLQRSDVGEGHARILRLSAGISAVHVRITEQA